jgi:hypothetical protein
MTLDEFIEQLRLLKEENPNAGSLTVCLADWQSKECIPSSMTVCVFVATGSHENKSKWVEGEFIQIGTS